MPCSEDCLSQQLRRCLVAVPCTEQAPFAYSLKECLIVVGILMGYLNSYLLISEVGGWRSMLGLSIIPAIVLGSGMVSTLEVLLRPIAQSSLHAAKICGVRPLDARELLGLYRKCYIGELAHNRMIQH